MGTVANRGTRAPQKGSSSHGARRREAREPGQEPRLRCVYLGVNEPDLYSYLVRKEDHVC